MIMAGDLDVDADEAIRSTRNYILVCQGSKNDRSTVIYTQNPLPSILSELGLIATDSGRFREPTPQVNVSSWASASRPAGVPLTTPLLFAARF